MQAGAGGGRLTKRKTPREAKHEIARTSLLELPGMVSPMVQSAYGCSRGGAKDGCPAEEKWGRWVGRSDEPGERCRRLGMDRIGSARECPWPR